MSIFGSIVNSYAIVLKSVGHCPDSALMCNVQTKIRHTYLHINVVRHIKISLQIYPRIDKCMCVSVVCDSQIAISRK